MGRRCETSGMWKSHSGTRPMAHAAAAARMGTALAGAMPTGAMLSGALLLAGCAAHVATHAAPPADATVAVRMPPRPAPTVCLGCGTISSREPWEIPRWKYHVQMDDGTESIVFQERADWLVLGARVRIAGGEMHKPD